MTSRWILGCAVLGAAMLPTMARAGEMPEYWPKFPHPKTLYVTHDMNAFPSTGGNDPGGAFGSLTFTLQSLAGLAAAGVKDGTCDAMIWLNEPANTSYKQWRDDVLRVTGARRTDAPDGLELIRQFAGQGLVKGYILYRADPSERNRYDAPPEGKDYNNSANVATSLAASLHAIIVEEQAEPYFKSLNLPKLLDVCDKDEAWLFANHRDKLSRKLVHVIDPKAPHMRDYAIATGSMCIYGISPTTDEVLKWVEPNAPAMGWVAGDEYKGTSQLSRFGHFTTASNWIFNLCAISTIAAETDAPWTALRVNVRQAFDPLEMDWPQGVHFTAFVMSDGNNFMWFLGDFLKSPSYWEAPSRGKFPMG